MAILFDEDYQTLETSGLEFEEDQTQRFLVIKNFPLTNACIFIRALFLSRLRFFGSSRQTTIRVAATCSGFILRYHGPMGKRFLLSSDLEVTMLVTSRGRNTAGGRVIGIVPHGYRKLTTSRRLLIESNGR